MEPISPISPINLTLNFRERNKLDLFVNTDKNSSMNMDNTKCDSSNAKIDHSKLDIDNKFNCIETFGEDDSVFDQSPQMSYDVGYYQST